MLTKKAMVWFQDHYLGDQDPTHPHFSPGLIDDHSNLAPATVFTAEYDPLRDEGDAYAALLRDAGVDVDHRCFAGMIHGFFGMGTITPVATEAVDAAAANLRSALA
jgi:acetyl esterase